MRKKGALAASSADVLPPFPLPFPPSQQNLRPFQTICVEIAAGLWYTQLINIL